MTPDQFRQWRKGMGWTQDQAAHALDISKSSVGNFEAGKRREDGRPVTIPRTVALACAALKAGIPPYGDEAIG